MPIPARLLRAHAEDRPGARYRPTDKERERETRIIDAATGLFARFGRIDFTMGNFALALRMSPITLRRHFPDPDTLLAEILYRHLAAIGESVGIAVDPKAARRRAYVAATRTPFNAPTERHLLLLRERHSLPPDLLGPIEDLRLQIGGMIAGDNAEAALALLDTPSLQPEQVETMLAALAPKSAASLPAKIAPAAPQARPASPRPSAAPVAEPPRTTPSRHAAAAPPAAHPPHRRRA